jgi:hypothetical protein
MTLAVADKALTFVTEAEALTTTVAEALVLLRIVSVAVALTTTLAEADGARILRTVDNALRTILTVQASAAARIADALTARIIAAVDFTALIERSVEEACTTMVAAARIPRIAVAVDEFWKTMLLPELAIARVTPAEAMVRVAAVLKTTLEEAWNSSDANHVSIPRISAVVNAPDAAGEKANIRDAMVPSIGSVLGVWAPISWNAVANSVRSEAPVPVWVCSLPST